MQNPDPRPFIVVLALLLILIVLMGYVHTAYSTEKFNIHALEIDNPDQPIADLAWFTQDNGQIPGVYPVTVYVNGERQRDIQHIAFATGPDGKLVARLTPAMLTQWGVNTAAFPPLQAQPEDKPLDDLDAIIPMAKTALRFNTLQLDVSIPQAAMNTTARGWVDPAEWDNGVPALLLNYSVTGNSSRYRASGSSQSQYANLNSGLNIGPWRLRNYSTWNSDDGQSRWESINTYAERNVPALKSQLTLGDSFTASDIFDSVQFRGAQLASDDAMLPDSLRGFAPVIRGIAQSTAQVTIRQNGYVIYQSSVAPGAFTIDDLYPTSGSGDLEVTIKEADGSERKFTQPFSAVPIMQREGRLKYALTGGKYRSSTDSDKPEFIQSTFIYGLPRAVTAYSGVLYSGNYRAAALGLGFGFGTLGSLSADATTAHTSLEGDRNRQGQSYRVQYSKDIQTSGTSFTLAAYRYSTKGFYTFQEANDFRSDSANGGLTTFAKRQKMQLDISQNAQALGSLFLSGYQQSYWGQSGYERTLSAGWNNTFKGVNLSVVYSYSRYPGSAQPADQQVALNVQVPLSRFLPNAWASYSATASRGGDTRHQLGINGTALPDNNLSYSLQQGYASRGSVNSGALSATYRGTYGELSGGYSYDDSMQQVNYGLRGGVVAHPHGVTLSQSLGQSLALVRAPGASGVKVQNNTGVYTDWRGYAVVPYVNPYKKNRVALATETLGDDVDLESSVQTVVPTQGAVVLANFNTRTGKRVLMTLLYKGLPVPFGAQATLKNGGSGIVGDDGQVYLTGVPDKGEIAVSWSGAKRCVVRYRLPDSGARPVTSTEQECL